MTSIIVNITAHLPLVGELRGGASFFYFETGDQTELHAKHFAAELVDIMHHYAPGNKRIAIDRLKMLVMRPCLNII